MKLTLTPFINFFLFTLLLVNNRGLSTQAEPSGKNDTSPVTGTATSSSKSAQGSKQGSSNSLVMNLFSGQIRTDLVFPYPDVLNDEQYEILEMVQGPTGKLYENFDPLVAEEKEAYEEEHMEQMRSMGGFGIMVPPEYGMIFSSLLSKNHSCYFALLHFFRWSRTQ